MGAKVCLVVYYFNFEKNCDILMSKSHVFHWTKIQTLIKTKINQKWKICHMLLEWETLHFRSDKNCKLKVRLWDGRKKSAFFVTFIFFEKNVLIFVFYFNVYCIESFRKYIL